jgi:inorganic triphosphatase YgiF
MLTETELKLQLSAESLAAIPAHPLVQARLDGDWQRLELFNQYYDSADLALDRAGFALRLRRDGDCLIQTLKARGNSLAGLSVRHEWDWYLDSPALSLPALQEPGLPEVLHTLDLNALQPLFRTDFVRRRARLCWEHEGEPVALELALDEGEVVSRDRRSPIRELELELREGPEAALREFAVMLAEDVTLLPCDSAKAERGYRLLDPSRRAALPALPQATQPPELLLPELIHWLLAKALSEAESLSSGRHDAMPALGHTVHGLESALTLLGQLRPHALPRLLMPVLARVRHELNAAASAQAARAVLEGSPRWGWLVLTLAQTLAGPAVATLLPALGAEQQATLQQLYREMAHDD